MLISSNRNPSLNDFIELIRRTLNFMNQEVYDYPERARYYRSRNGAKLEEDVYRVLSEQAMGTEFEDTIQLVSNRSFPDIVAARYYGVEVKTSKKGWRSVGSSIMESSRIQDVEHICLFFGKLDENVEFRANSYEECLSDIVVTHSPRYSIDMNLGSEHTIFEKMNTEYDAFRNLESPIEVVKDYYRSSLKPGQDLWWMSNNEQALSPVVQLWNTLKTEEKRYYQIQGFCWFPEIFSNHQRTKYNRFALWLTTENGIVPTALRDIYSAGGRDYINVRGKIIDDQPQIMVQLSQSVGLVKKVIIAADAEWIKEMWKVDRVYEGKDRIRQWIELISYWGIVDKDALYIMFDV